MKIRYCMTPLQQISPCEVGWTTYSNIESKSCSDEPMGKNCRYIVDTERLWCPHCRGRIDMPMDAKRQKFELEMVKEFEGVKE